MITDFEYLYMIRQSSVEAYSEMSGRFERLLWKHAHTNFRIQQPDGVQVSDLYQEGIIGLIEAIVTFRESREVGLAHYVSLCVDSHIRSALRKCRSMSYRLLDSSVSLDMHISEDNSLSLIDIIEDKSKDFNPSYQAVLEEGKGVLKYILGEIPVIEQKVYRLWVLGYSYEEVADELSISAKQVDNILQKIKKLLQRPRFFEV